MAHYIDKDALVAEINKRLHQLTDAAFDSMIGRNLIEIKEFVENLEVKEVGISIPNIDDILKEEDIDPDSKEAKVFKESYYMTLEKLKAQKGEEL